MQSPQLTSESEDDENDANFSVRTDLTKYEYFREHLQASDVTLRASGNHLQTLIDDFVREFKDIRSVGRVDPKTSTWYYNEKIAVDPTELSVRVQMFFRQWEMEARASSLFSSIQDWGKFLEGFEKFLMINIGNEAFGWISKAEKAEDMELFRRIRAIKSLASKEMPWSKHDIVSEKLMADLRPEIERLEDAIAPSDKHAAMVSVCRLIEMEMNRLRNEKETYVSADDYLPCVNYAILLLNPPMLLTHVRYVVRFRRISQLQGQDAVFLTYLLIAGERWLKVTPEELGIDPDAFALALETADDALVSEEPRSKPQLCAPLMDMPKFDETSVFNSALTPLRHGGGSRLWEDDGEGGEKLEEEEEEEEIVHAVEREKTLPSPPPHRSKSVDLEWISPVKTSLRTPRQDGSGAVASFIRQLRGLRVEDEEEEVVRASAATQTSACEGWSFADATVETLTVADIPKLLEEYKALVALQSLGGGGGGDPEVEESGKGPL